jgi:hypothetical protein
LKRNEVPAQKFKFIKRGPKKEDQKKENFVCFMAIFKRRRMDGWMDAWMEGEG